MYRLLITIITALTLCCTVYASEASASVRESASLTLEDALTQLAEYGDKMADEDTFSGTILLAKDDKILYSAAHGMASKRFAVPNNLQTKLNLGSMNKMFTAVAIMQLVEKEKISLDDRLGKYLDESWISKDISAKIKIRHLLTHTSGLGSYFNRRFAETSKNHFRALADYKPLIVGETLQFEPGSSAHYSNTGMFLLGAVIEAATGQSYFDYIRRKIYEPAGMINSGCYEMDQPVPNLAMGYSRNGENKTGWNNNLYLHVLKGGPAGGCFSTVEDLYKFSTALVGYKLLEQENTETLYSKKTELRGGSYGYGFSVRATPDDRIVGHSGGFSGISSNLDIFLDTGYVAVVLSNYSGAARPLRAKIRSLLLRISNQ